MSGYNELQNKRCRSPIHRGVQCTAMPSGTAFFRAFFLLFPPAQLRDHIHKRIPVPLRETDIKIARAVAFLVGEIEEVAVPDCHRLEGLAEGNIKDHAGEEQLLLVVDARQHVEECNLPMRSSSMRAAYWGSLHVGQGATVGHYGMLVSCRRPWVTGMVLRQVERQTTAG
jgi:hypothetical protein